MACMPFFLFCVRGGMENAGYVFKLIKFIYLLSIKWRRKASLLGFVLQNFLSLQSIIILCSVVLDVFPFSIALLVGWMLGESSCPECIPAGLGARRGLRVGGSWGIFWHPEQEQAVGLSWRNRKKWEQNRRQEAITIGLGNKILSHPKWKWWDRTTWESDFFPEILSS